jgi:hypothetical protein
LVAKGENAQPKGQRLDRQHLVRAPPLLRVERGVQKRFDSLREKVCLDPVENAGRADEVVDRGIYPSEEVDGVRNQRRIQEEGDRAKTRVRERPSRLLRVRWLDHSRAPLPDAQGPDGKHELIVSGSSLRSRLSRMSGSKSRSLRVRRAIVRSVPTTWPYATDEDSARLDIPRRRSRARSTSPCNATSCAATSAKGAMA